MLATPLHAPLRAPEHPHSQGVNPTSDARDNTERQSFSTRRNFLWSNESAGYMKYQAGMHCARTWAPGWGKSLRLPLIFTGLNAIIPLQMVVLGDHNIPAYLRIDYFLISCTIHIIFELC